jgi:hypothetical protein
MGLEKVHPQVLTRVKDQLPEGYTLVDAVATSESVAVFTVEKDGVLGKATMPKVNLLDLLKGRVIDITATQGESLDKVVLELADKYRIHLVSGTDYDVGNQVVDFQGGCSYQVSVPTLASSVSVMGALIFVVRDEVQPCSALEHTSFDVEGARVRLALAGKIFKVEAPEVAEDGLSMTLCEDAAAFIGGLGFDYKPTVEDFFDAKVQVITKDTVSDLAIVQLPSGLIVPVRFAV